MKGERRREGVRVLLYEVELLDFLFYAREGALGVETPKLLHATALNHAVACALNLLPQEQPYLTPPSSAPNGGPRYDSSLHPKLGFYFTPGELVCEGGSEVPARVFVVKGDDEAYLNRVTPAEVLRATSVSMLPPETSFRGFVLVRKGKPSFPRLIRLGRFRCPARVRYWELSEPMEDGEGPVDHPVDPLVTETVRGTLMEMFPYPLVAHATVRRRLTLRFPERKEMVSVGVPDEW